MAFFPIPPGLGIGIEIAGTSKKKKGNAITTVTGVGIGGHGMAGDNGMDLGCHNANLDPIGLDFGSSFHIMVFGHMFGLI